MDGTWQWLLDDGATRQRFLFDKCIPLGGGGGSCGSVSKKLVRRTGSPKHTNGSAKPARTGEAVRGREMPRYKVVLRVLLDISIFIILCVTYYVVTTVVPPYQRGFFCDDDRIVYKKVKPFVSTAVMSGFGILIALVLVIPIEAVYYCKYRQHASYLRPASRYGVPALVYYLYRFLGSYTFINFMCQILTDVSKVSVGALRPHFMDVCRPNMSTINCSLGYITDFVCTGDADLVTEARKSFVSGHSSFTFTSAFFLALYLEWRMVWRAVQLLKVVLQGGLAAIALWVSFTRLQDHNHHPEDVLAGAIMGVFAGICGAVLIAGMFRETSSLKPRQKKDSERRSELSNINSKPRLGEPTPAS